MAIVEKKVFFNRNIYIRYWSTIFGSYFSCYLSMRQYGKKKSTIRTNIFIL
ncbi:hypothetical protein QW060_19580 [Myroides ceti]|uniref:Uncharacterized protein n=1 Tax=Paenimyroides ceti TaxID=395087 RepID=A0ABT8CXE1_9FLAO|nr:hypothetical protein [Paenimyroides ceti]MDN3709228.1 hypothetical protein [Paenimyroides ceti]